MLTLWCWGLDNAHIMVLGLSHYGAGDCTLWGLDNAHIMVLGIRQCSHYVLGIDNAHIMCWGLDNAHIMAGD